MRLLSRDDSKDRREANKAVSPPIADVDQFPSDYSTWRAPNEDGANPDGDALRDRVLHVHPGSVDVETIPWQAPLPDDADQPRNTDAPFVPLDAVVYGPVETASASWESTESAAAPASDPDAPFIPLGASPVLQHPINPRIVLGAAIATVIAIAVWILAEVQYVNGNAWGKWDEVWYAAGVVTIVASVGWLAYGYRWYQHRKVTL